jgi:hypothetical protein
MKSAVGLANEPVRGSGATLFSRILGFLNARLFPDHGATNLAIMRILLGGYSAWYLWSYRFDLVRTSTEISHKFYEPVGVVRLLTTPLDDQLFVMLFTLCGITSVLFTLGVFFRVVGPFFALLFLFILTYRQSWGFIYHTENLLVLHLGVLGFAPSAQALSADSALASLRPKLRRLLAIEDDRAPGWKFGWPVQLMIFVTGITYWVAGMAKLGRSGFSWV